jgi:hypothetical protein
MDGKKVKERREKSLIIACITAVTSLDGKLY